MTHEDIIEINGVDVAKDVRSKIENIGVKGLDFNKAMELGIFSRIGTVLSVTHTTIMSAMIIYGYIDHLFDLLHARKNEISREMNTLEKAWDRFAHFWTDYYMKDANKSEILYQAERLSKQIMRWMQVPDEWKFGDSQRSSDDIDVAIKIPQGDDVYTFRTTNVNKEILSEEESWCVMMYNTSDNVQTIVNSDMDKASALMTAKRLSANDTEHIYTAARVRDATERFTEITPIKAFKGNDTIGKINHKFKK